jgi:putative ABC transport system ATP-binding protein
LGSKGVYAMTWGCEVEEVSTRRGKDYCLSIKTLKIRVDEKNGGRKIPLMGVSGAGKSTLLNLLSGMAWPERGRVSWNFPDGTGISWAARGLSSVKAKHLRMRYFGYAFQDSSLLPHLTVMDNLAYPLQLRGVASSKARLAATEALNQVLRDDENLEDMLKKYPSKLSGGQRQRIGLTQAMIHNPNVLFADEPTGSLDSLTRRQVMKTLLSWVEAGQGKRLLLWVTHHENDPHDNKADMRLTIESETCKWEKWNSSAWVECRGLD